MQAVSLPACASGLRSRAHRSTEVDLVWIARKLGLVDATARTIIKHVRALAAGSGFPLPKRPRFVKGQRITGPDCIDARSIWDRDAVEAWFEDDLPPAGAAALAAARRSTVAVELDRRALELVVSR
jgi:hypothetical protein